MNAAVAAGHESPLALICGGGSLPLAVAQSVSARGRGVVMFLLRGSADPKLTTQLPHHWVYPGQLGKIFRIARAAGISDAVFIGAMVRPRLWQIRPDLTALMSLPRIAAAFRGGDDHLLTGVAHIIEQHGFRLLGAHDIAPEIKVPQGVLGRAQPSASDRADIAFGLDYLRAASPFDIGQAVAVIGKHVVAVEAAEGTDEMLLRVAEMRASGRLRAASGTGVLVKAAKARQDRRFDLPSIGPQTVAGVARAGLAGIAVIAGETIIAEPEQVVIEADRANIFVIGAAGTQE